MLIKGFVKTSLVDYPGNIVSSIFLGGCNFSCGYCHNPDLALNAGSLEVFSEKEVLSYISKQKRFLDGVCVTGGEPTLYEKELPLFLSKIKGLGFKVKLDTNGTNPELLQQLITQGLVDYVAVDIKAPLKDYASFVGKNLGTKKILETISLLINSGIDYEFRTTALPNLKKEDFVEIAKHVAKAKKYYIQQFRNSTKLLNEAYEHLIPYTKEELEDIRGECQKFVPTQLRL